MMKRLTNILFIVMILITTMSGIISCNTIPEPEPATDIDLVSVLVQTNLQSTTINNTLNSTTTTTGFDMNTWVYEYNLNSYTLTFKSDSREYTFTKTIQELITGFSITISPDTYTITYKSTPDDNLSQFCNIEINEVKTISKPEDLVLSASVISFLVVVEIESIQDVRILDPTFTTFKTMLSKDNLFYLYGHTEQNGYKLYYKSSVWPNPEFNYSLPIMYVGNIYHIRKSITGNTSISIKKMIYNSVVI